jgi:site-specific DNA-methyltransferase (adenine-specific)
MVSPDPYYHDGQVTLWCGDARQIATWLAADVLVTDPPYGVQAKRRRGTWSMPEERADAIAGDTDTEVRDTILGMWAQRALPGDTTIPVDAWWGRPAVVFGAVGMEAPYPTRKTLIYRKPPDAGTHGAVAGFRHDVEAVYLMGRPGLWPTDIGGRSSVLTTGARSVGGPGGPAARYGHQHAKPVDVMEELVRLTMWPVKAHTQPWTVADPFAGAGSTIVAARNLGLSVLAVELEEPNCERIVARLKQGALSFDD